MGTTQNNIETYRWTNLGDSFIALGTVLQQERTNIEINAEAQAKALYRSVYQQVCQFCSKVRWCWGEECAYTIDTLRSVCDVLAEQGLRKESAFSTRFQGRCLQARGLEIALFNQIAHSSETLQQRSRYNENKANIAHQLIMIGEQMKRMRQPATADDSPERLAVGYASSRKEHVSGDSWGVIDLQDGRLVQILCDGMGSGTLAMEQSHTAVELLKTLLAGGLSIRLSLNVMNTVLALQYEGVRFSTVDVAVWNLRSKKIELYKYGAAPSFVRNGRKISTYISESLPVGILPRIEGTYTEHAIQQGDLLIMMSDGLYELTSTQFQWEEIIGCLPTANPQLMAEYLLAIATSRSRGNQKLAEQHDEQALEADDMTILVSRLVPPE